MNPLDSEMLELFNKQFRGALQSYKALEDLLGGSPLRKPSV